VAEKAGGSWVTHQWIKKAVLLYFRAHDNAVVPDAGSPGAAHVLYTRWFDKVPLKFDGYSKAQFREGGFRVVPPAVVRTGAYIGRNVVLMPSYVNIGAYVDEGAMVDTWATVGSCAQVGKHVHLSGGVGIGGVLEPLQANPTIIEDNCFIGARSEIVEGVIVEANSVISMGVFIGQSTKIYDRATGEIHYGRVPSGSVVVPATLAMAQAGHGVAIIPSALRTHRYVLRLLRVLYRGKPLSEPLTILFDKRRPLPAHAKVFCDMLAERAKKVFPVKHTGPVK